MIFKVNFCINKKYIETYLFYLIIFIFLFQNSIKMLLYNPQIRGEQKN